MEDHEKSKGRKHEKRGIGSRERLRWAGMVRCLGQFDNGTGDYAKERREWVDETSLDDIRRAARRGRRKGKP